MAASEARADLAAIVSRLQADFAELAAYLEGGVAQAQAGARGLKIPSPSRLSAAADLAALFQSGIKVRTFSDHLFFIASEQVNQTANTTRLGRKVDELIVSPTIDAQIEFDKEVQNSTPTVYAGTAYRHPGVTSFIKHRATSKTQTGQLMVWAYWY